MGVLYRSTLKSGSIMCGYYRYADVFQIIESNKVGSMSHGKFLDIEYDQSYGNLPLGKVIQGANDDLYVNRLQKRAHLDFLNELISLLSIVTNQYYDLDFARGLNIRPPAQTVIDGFSDVSSILEIRKDPDRINQRQNFTMSFLSIHPDADDFFGNYFRLSSEARSRYMASVLMYQRMRKIFLTSASMAIVGLISAIENLMDFESKKSGRGIGSCEKCGQPVYSISKRFKEFMLKFSEFDSENANALLNKFYSKRSTITHAGRILEVDMFLSKFSMREHADFTEIETHVRLALFNYLLKYDFSDEPA